MSEEIPQLTPRSRFAWRRRWTMRLMLAAAALVVMTYLAAANYIVVEIRLIGWQGDVRLAWALFGAIVFGVLLGMAGRAIR